MADDTPQTPSQSPNEQTWFQWPGMSVYGATEGAEPPDMERPWDFQPPATIYNTAQQSGQPAPPPQQAPQPAPQQSPAPPAAEPEQQPPAPMPPAPMQQAPPPQAAPPQPPSMPMPSPTGPAVTPDDRARQLGLIPDNSPPPEQPRSDENQ